MAWRLVHIEEEDEIDSDLTSGELIGISVVLARFADGDGNCYDRAWEKIQPQVNQAIEED